MHEFRTQRRVEFADTDMAGICHFARYAVFMETAEHEMLVAIGQSVHMKHDGREIGWPRVRIELEYQRPAHFGDLLDIHVRVLRKGTKSMTYGFTFTRDGEEIASRELEGGTIDAYPLPEPAGALVVSGQKKLRCIDAEGKELWRAEVDGYVGVLRPR